MPARLKTYFFLVAFLATFLFFTREISAVMSLTFSGAPSSVEGETPFEVDASLIDAPASRTYYLRAAFHEEGKTRYFGYTFNNIGSWHNSPGEHKSFLEITTNSEGRWEGKLKAKVDLADSDFKGTGDYRFKIGRYTEGGSLPWSDNSVTIFIKGGSTSTPTPVPLPSTATYQVNEVRDEEDNVISSVKVYLDNVYLHHYAPEVLTFCGGCQCDTYVDCGFGEHTIKLEKSGFNHWIEKKTINSGDFYEINPVMTKSQTISSSVVSPTPSSLGPSPRAVELTATLAGEVLGQESTPGGIYLLEPSPSPEATEEGGGNERALPIISLGSGLIFLSAAGFYLWYTKWR